MVTQNLTVFLPIKGAARAEGEILILLYFLVLSIRFSASEIVRFDCFEPACSSYFRATVGKSGRKSGPKRGGITKALSPVVER
jgi:hypothetical protein